MATGNTIKEFLASLGFEIDEGSYQKFQSKINDATKAVAKFGVAVAAAATAVFYGVSKTEPVVQAVMHEVFILRIEHSEILQYRDIRPRSTAPR